MEECVTIPTKIQHFFQNNYKRRFFDARIEDLPCFEQGQTLAQC